MLGADHCGNVCCATLSRAMLRGVLDAVLPSYEVRESHEIAVYASLRPRSPPRSRYRQQVIPSWPRSSGFGEFGRGSSTPRLFSAAPHQTSDLDAHRVHRARRLPRRGDRVRYLGGADRCWWDPPRHGNPCPRRRFRGATALPALLACRRSVLRSDPAPLACCGAPRRRNKSVISPRMSARADSQRSRRAARR